jgi:MFS family permease
MQKKMTKNLSIAEGMLYSGIGTGTQGFVLASLAMYFNATPLMLSMMMTLLYTTRMFQLLTPKFYKVFKTRKRVLMVAALISRNAFLIVPVAMFFQYRNPYILLIAMLIFSFFETIVSNVWTAAMNEIVDEKDRGSYFGKRSVMGSLASIVFTYGYGYLLGMKNQEIGIFSVAVFMAISGIVTTVIFKFHSIPDLKEESKKIDLSIPLKDKKFMIYLKFVAVWVFSFEFVKPFFAYYQVNILRVDPKFLATMGIITGAGSMLMYYVYGKMSDKYGSKLIMNIGMFLSTYSLIIYLVISEDNYKFLLLLDAIIIAITFTAINLSFFNLLILEISDYPMESYFAVFSIVIGVVAACSSIIGGSLGNILMDKTFVIFGETYHGIKLIFLLGMGTRFFAILHFTNVETHIKEFKYKGILPVNSAMFKRISSFLPEYLKVNKK